MQSHSWELYVQAEQQLKQRQKMVLNCSQLHP